jgi:hypothetical protein
MRRDAFSFAVSEHNKSERSERTIDRLSASACVRLCRGEAKRQSRPSLRRHLQVADADRLQ